MSHLHGLQSSKLTLSATVPKLSASKSVSAGRDTTSNKNTASVSHNLPTSKSQIQVKTASTAQSMTKHQAVSPRTIAPTSHQKPSVKPPAKASSFTSPSSSITSVKTRNTSQRPRQSTVFGGRTQKLKEMPSIKGTSKESKESPKSLLQNEVRTILCS